MNIASLKRLPRASLLLNLSWPHRRAFFSGGAIILFIGTTLNISGSRFISNRAFAGPGGHISFGGGYVPLSVSDSLFLDGSATRCGYGHGDRHK